MTWRADDALIVAQGFVRAGLIFSERSPAATPRSAGRRKSSISSHQYDSMSAIGNLWNLSVVGPFIAGSVQMTKLTWSQCLQGNPDDVVGVEPFPKGASS